MCTNIQKWRISRVFENMKDKAGRRLCDDGKEMCYTHHLRGNCFSDCWFQNDYRRQLSSEAIHLLSWAKNANSWKIGRQQSKLLVAVPVSSMGGLKNLSEVPSLEPTWFPRHWTICFAPSCVDFPGRSVFKFPTHSSNNQFITLKLGKTTVTYTLSKSSTCSETNKSGLSSSVSVPQSNQTSTCNNINTQCPQILTPTTFPSRSPHHPFFKCQWPLASQLGTHFVPRKPPFWILSGKRFFLHLTRRQSRIWIPCSFQPSANPSKHAFGNISLPYIGASTLIPIQRGRTFPGPPFSQSPWSF